MGLPVVIREAADEQDISHFRDLTREYIHYLAEDLSFQGTDDEISSLPGDYAPPLGAILLALDGGQVAGGVAIRPATHEDVGGSVCVMKRMFVRPEHRGKGIGTLLAEEAVKAGKRLGYQEMILDTLERLVGANRTYKTLGFSACAPFYVNPLEGAVFMHRSL